MTTEASWQQLEDFFYERLVRETVLPSVTIVAWGEAGQPAAHRAIWRYATEMGERSRFDLLAGVTKFTREEMRLAGYPDSMSQIDTCTSGQ